jgi:hypothetical protein
MEKLFTRERFGHPQVIAAVLLLLFVAQCLWLVGRGILPLQVDATEMFRVQEGLLQLRGESVAGTPSPARMEASISPPLEVEDNAGYDPNHSPLWYLIAAAPLSSWSANGQTPAFVQRYWGWLARLPYLIFGILLGASLWYVSRRLYGNQAGYIALTLYCFSPGILRGSTLWVAQPEMGAAWGTFGAIFTSIAVAHTLYAPREVVIWNWRRILLLGLSLALAIGSQFSLIILVPLALGFMFYLAPERRSAALAIWTAACAVACFLLFAAYAFHPGAMWQSLRHASFFEFSWRALTMHRAYASALLHLHQVSPILLFTVPVALVAYGLWPRSRYFGNTAPLLVAVWFLLLALGSPHYPGLGFLLMAVPFLIVFVAGIIADLSETPERKAVLGCVWGLLALHALWNLWQLARIAHS